MRCRHGLSLVVLAVALAASAAVGQSKQSTAQDQLNFGIDMARRGLWSEALFRFQRAEQLEPSNLSALNNMAVAYEALGLFDDALATYRKALEIDPQNSDLKRNYSRFAEFYQAFRGDEDEDGESEDATSGEGEHDNPKAPDAAPSDTDDSSRED